MQFLEPGAPVRTSATFDQAGRPDLVPNPLDPPHADVRMWACAKGKYATLAEVSEESRIVVTSAPPEREACGWEIKAVEDNLI